MHDFKAYFHLDYKLSKEVVGKNNPIVTEYDLNELLDRVEEINSLSDLEQTEPMWYVADINFR